MDTLLIIIMIGLVAVVVLVLIVYNSMLHNRITDTAIENDRLKRENNSLEKENKELADELAPASMTARSPTSCARGCGLLSSRPTRRTAARAVARRTIAAPAAYGFQFNGSSPITRYGRMPVLRSSAYAFSRLLAFIQPSLFSLSLVWYR